MNWLRKFTSPEGVRVAKYAALVVGVAIGIVSVILIIKVGALAQQVDQDRRALAGLVRQAEIDRLAGCERGNIARHEIRLVASTLRNIVVLVVRAAPPVSQMPFERRVLHEELKASARGLAQAIERLGPVVCKSPIKE